MTTNAEQFAQQVGADIKALNQKITALETAANGSTEAANNPVKSHLLIWGANIAAGYNDSIARRNLSVKNGVGIIHLDFKAAVASGNVIVATLPAAAPTFEMNCDVNISSGGHIWINKGQRDIYAAGIKANTRIIVDIVGFVR